MHFINHNMRDTSQRRIAFQSTQQDALLNTKDESMFMSVSFKKELTVVQNRRAVSSENLLSMRI
jgi:hypothetical protein